MQAWPRWFRPRLHLIRFHGVLAPNAKLRPAIIPNAPVNANAPSAEHGDAPQHSAPTRMSLSPAAQTSIRDRHRAVPRCGGAFKIIAALEHPRVIAKILAHLGLPIRAPPRAPARAFDRPQMA